MLCREVVGDDVRDLAALVIAEALIAVERPRKVTDLVPGRGRRWHVLRPQVCARDRRKRWKLDLFRGRADHSRAWVGLWPIDNARTIRFRWCEGRLIAFSPDAILESLQLDVVKMRHGPRADLDSGERQSVIEPVSTKVGVEIGND